MISENNTEKILKLFIKNPTREFQYREINRITKLGSSTVKRSLNILKKKQLIKKEKGNIYDFYIANRENSFFKSVKIFYTLINLNKIVNKIVEKTRPNCIVLFGSAAKGEDFEKSDIDIFIQARRKDLNFSRAEKRLNRKLSFIFESNIKKLNKELLNNLANGITLYGALEVKK